MNTQVSTKTTKPIRWLFWYTWIIVGLSALALRNDPIGLLYAIPINWLLYVIPVWLIVSFIRWIRRKPVPLLTEDRPPNSNQEQVP